MKNSGMKSATGNKWSFVWSVQEKTASCFTSILFESNGKSVYRRPLQLPLYNCNLNDRMCKDFFWKLPFANELWYAACWVVGYWLISNKNGYNRPTKNPRIFLLFNNFNNQNNALIIYTTVEEDGLKQCNLPTIEITITWLICKFAWLVPICTLLVHWRPKNCFFTVS